MLPCNAFVPGNGKMKFPELFHPPFQPDMENLPCPWCHTWFALCCFIASATPWNTAMGFKSRVQFTQSELSEKLQVVLLK